MGKGKKKGAGAASSDQKAVRVGVEAAVNEAVALQVMHLLQAQTIGVFGHLNV